MFDELISWVQHHPDQSEAAFIIFVVLAFSAFCVWWVLKGKPIDCWDERDRDNWGV